MRLTTPRGQGNRQDLAPVRSAPLVAEERSVDGAIHHEILCAAGRRRRRIDARIRSEAKPHARDWRGL